MGRYKQAPRGYECPYQHACPHLDGLSATGALLLLRDVDRDWGRDGPSMIEAEKEIKALDDENRDLSARVAELESRLRQQHRLRFKPNRKARPERKDAPCKRGAPVGHRPWRRPVPERIDRSVVVPAPCVCPHCKRQGITALEDTHVQIQEDIVL